MRLCLLTAAPFPTDRRAYRTAKTLVAAGHSVVVVCRGAAGTPDYDRIEGIDIRRIDPESAFAGATGVLAGARYVATLVHPTWRDAIEEIDDRGVSSTAEDAPGDRVVTGDASDDATTTDDTTTDDPTYGAAGGMGSDDRTGGTGRGGLDAIHVHDLALVKTALAVGNDREFPVVADLRENYPAAVRQRRQRWRARDRLREPRALAQRAFLFPWRLGRLEAACVEDVDRLVVNCEEARARYLRDLGVDPADVTVIRDAVASVPDVENVEDRSRVNTPEVEPLASLSGTRGSVGDAPSTDAETVPFEFDTGASGSSALEAGTPARERGAVGSETVAPEAGPGALTAPETQQRRGLASSADAPADLAAPFDHEDAFVVTAREEFARDRGLDTLIEAAALAAEDAVDLRVVIVGTPRPGEEGMACRRDLDALARRRLIGGRTLFGTVADPDRAAAHVAASDAFVLPQPPTTHAETTVSPMLYAALAGGTPVVATDVGPQRRIVERTGAGLVVPADDPEAMATALADLRAPERADVFAANARSAVEAGGAFDPDRDADRLRAVYESLRGPETPVIEIG